MNWDATSAVSEIIGALAVVISVCYLAIQIRKHTLESKLTATRELSAQHLDLLKTVATDEILPDIWLRGARDYHSLDNTERLRLSILYTHIMRNFEQQFIHARTDAAERTYLESINREYSQFLSFPGFQQWWETSGYVFDELFKAHLDNLIAEESKKGFQSSFNPKTDAPSN